MVTDDIIVVGGAPDLRGRLETPLAGSGIRILAAFKDLRECAAAAGPLMPDLVLLGDAAEKDSAADAVIALQDMFPTAQVVALASSGSRDLVAACMDAGASSCLPSAISPEALSHSLRLILLGERLFVATSVTGRSGQPAERRADSRRPTDCEAEIVFNGGRGGSRAMSCTILDLSEGGAKLRPSDLLSLPRHFELRIAHGPVCQCETVRHSGACVGVRFTAAGNQAGSPRPGLH